MNKEQEIGFPAIIRKDGRITILEPVRKSLDLKVGDSVYITNIRKIGGATCPDCNGLLEKRTFIDTPEDICEDWWCPACRLRWQAWDFEPEEAKGP